MIRARSVATVALALGIPVAANAQDAANGIDAQIYKPAMDPFGIFSTERAIGPKKYDLGFRFGVNFASEPLKVDTGGTDAMYDGEADVVLESQLTFNLGLSFGVSDDWSFALDVPFQRQPLGPGYGSPGRYAPVDPSQARVGTGFYSTRPDQNLEPSENHPGDVRLGTKYRFLRGKTAVAAQLIAWVPFGDEDVFAGSKGFTIEPKAILDLSLGDKVTIAINAGARIREGVLVETREVTSGGFVVNDAMGNAQYRSILYVGTEAVASVGARFEVAPQVHLGAEIYGLIPITSAEEGTCEDPCKDGDMAADALAGAFFRVSDDSWLSVAGGVGLLTDAARADSFRIVAGYVWSPTPEGARVGGRGDRDGDRIADGPDVCPDEPEDPDNFQDDDGCPELDNDLDGVLDAQDKCAAEPEDRDDFQDGDGCPEGDDDKDGVEDLTDRCPREAEDKDGFQDDDGCPDEDNDGDGILDGKDKCVDEAETVNGVDDLDGCPDQAVQGGPRLATDRIDLQGERVEFQGKTARFTRATESTLDGVAAVLKANPDVRIRIEVGVEASGDKKANKDADRRLTRERADAIVSFLQRKGVKPEQLDFTALGSDFPIDAKNPRDPKLNRRVEFIRVTQ